jgi:hypothetical protein
MLIICKLIVILQYMAVVGKLMLIPVFVLRWFFLRTVNSIRATFANDLFFITNCFISRFHSE